MKRIKKYIEPLTEAIVAWWNRDPFTQSAAIAYYTIFSFPALIIIYFATASLFVDQAILQDQVYNFLEKNFGESSSDQFRKIIKNTAPAHTDFRAFVIGGSVLAFTALKLFMQLQRALNLVWSVDDSGFSAVRKLVLRRVSSFSVMLAISFTLVVSLVATSMLTVLTKRIMLYLPEYFAFLFHGVNLAVNLSMLTLMLGLMLKTLPDTYVKWKHAVKGAMLAAVLFIGGQYGMGIYFNLVEPNSAYGVTGSIILLMIWVSYSGVILLLGAELSRVLQERGKQR